MSDPIIEGFRAEFDRFFDLLEKQIETCPDDLWTRKAGGFVVWQQFFHSLACILLFAGSEDVFTSLGYSPQVMMLSGESDKVMSREEMRTLAQKAKQKAHAFFDGQSTATLTEKNEGLSKGLGRDMTNQTAAIALIRHNCYHLGGCDAVLRDNGLPGVY